MEVKGNDIFQFLASILRGLLITLEARKIFFSL